jgi:hypothetical protein
VDDVLHVKSELFGAPIQGTLYKGNLIGQDRQQEQARQCQRNISKSFGHAGEFTMPCQEEFKV